MGFPVTEKAFHPDNDNGRCFHCDQPLGEEHKDCVHVQKKVTVRMTVVYDIEVPAHWDKETIESHRNEASWCASTAIEELETAFGEKSEHCLCDVAEFEYLGGDTAPYLDESCD